MECQNLACLSNSEYYQIKGSGVASEGLGVNLPPFVENMTSHLVTFI